MKILRFILVLVGAFFCYHGFFAFAARRLPYRPPEPGFTKGPPAPESCTGRGSAFYVDSTRRAEALYVCTAAGWKRLAIK